MRYHNKLFSPHILLYFVNWIQFGNLDAFCNNISILKNLQSRVPFYFSMFLQSGVYHELHKLKLFKDHQKRRSVTAEIRRRTEVPEILDMNSSIQTIFILFAGMSLLAKVVLAAELGYLAMCKRLNKVKTFNSSRVKSKLETTIHCKFWWTKTKMKLRLKSVRRAWIVVQMNKRWLELVNVVYVALMYLDPFTRFYCPEWVIGLAYTDLWLYLFWIL